MTSVANSEVHTSKSRCGGVDNGEGGSDQISSRGTAGAGDCSYEQSPFATLTTLLRKTRTPEKAHTHVLLGSPYGMYAIGAHMFRFWDLYCAELNQYPPSPLYLAETPGKEIPVLVDIDLKVKKTSSESAPESLRLYNKLYTPDQVRTVVATYQAVLRSICMDLDESALTCVLLEKDPYEQEINGSSYIKNGFHLHFPKLFLDAKVQQIYLIPIVKERLKGLFSALECPDFIDGNTVSVHWLLYGSKKPNNKPYLATRCFSNTCEEQSFEDALFDYVLPKLRGQTTATRCEGNVVALLPRILSISLYGRETLYYYRPQPSVNTPILNTYAAKKTVRRTYEQKSVAVNLEEATNLIQLLNPSRSDDRADWLTIGFCLWNITKGDDDGLSTWLSFSEQSAKFNEVECIYIWNSMHSNQYTIGTLKYFAKLDNPEAYDQLFKKQTSTIVTSSITGSHNDIAKLLYNEYGNEFVCSSVETKTWYRFKDHIWKVVDKGSDLRERISCRSAIVMSQLEEQLGALHTAIRVTCEEELIERDERNSTVTDLTDNTVRAYIDTQVKLKGNESKDVKAVRKLIQQCKSSPFKSNVMTECCEMFRNEQFAQLLNKDPYLVAFQNGVYDFANDLFRPGKPEDYISQALPIDYIDFGSPVHPRVMEITDFFRKVFPDKEIRDYFIDQACQLFVGGNSEKIILMWTGDGNNGKTVTQTLFEKMLGPLAVKFSTTLVTGKKSQIGCAAPELARAGDGVRWAVMDEPNQDELISSGILKGLTGNDSYWARDLFEKGKATREIIPMFKIHMICNKLPGIRDADQATWNRIRVIPFESKFVPQLECPDAYEDQLEQKRFPMDCHFSDKMKTLIEPLAWYLINKWRHYNKLERIEPDKVRVATRMYKQENDVYRQFADNNVVDKLNAKLMFNTVFIYFKEWFREECPNQQMPNRTAIKQRFTQIWGEPINGGTCWEGLEFRNSSTTTSSTRAPSDDQLTSKRAAAVVNPLI